MLISCHSFSPLRCRLFFSFSSSFFVAAIALRSMMMMMRKIRTFFLAYRLVKRIHRLIDPSRPRRRPLSFSVWHLLLVFAFKLLSIRLPLLKNFSFFLLFFGVVLVVLSLAWPSFRIDRWRRDSLTARRRRRRGRTRPRGRERERQDEEQPVRKRRDSHK